jgi:hypothetical protein
MIEKRGRVTCFEVEFVRRISKGRFMFSDRAFNTKRVSKRDISKTSYKGRAGRIQEDLNHK